METIPSSVQDFNLRITTNAVCVAVVKFTLDQFDRYFTTAEPAPAKLARQIMSLRSRYNVLNNPTPNSRSASRPVPSRAATTRATSWCTA